MVASPPLPACLPDPNTHHPRSSTPSTHATVYSIPSGFLVVFEKPNRSSFTFTFTMSGSTGGLPPITPTSRQTAAASATQRSRPGLTGSVGSPLARQLIMPPRRAPGSIDLKAAWVERRSPAAGSPAPATVGTQAAATGQGGGHSGGKAPPTVVTAAGGCRWCWRHTTAWGGRASLVGRRWAVWMRGGGSCLSAILRVLGLCAVCG